MIVNFFNPVLLRQRGLTLVRWVVFAVSYFLAAAFGAILIPPFANIPIVWPASGIALGVLLISKKRDWTVIALIIFAANLAAILVSGRGLATGLGFSLVSTIQSLASAWLVVGEQVVVQTWCTQVRLTLWQRLDQYLRQNERFTGQKDTVQVLVGQPQFHHGIWQVATIRDGTHPDRPVPLRQHVQCQPLIRADTPQGQVGRAFLGGAPPSMAKRHSRV